MTQPFRKGGFVITAAVASTFLVDEISRQALCSHRQICHPGAGHQTLASQMRGQMRLRNTFPPGVR